MPHLASLLDHYHGKPYGDGHCVALVRALSSLPATTHWRRGDPVSGSNLAPGTIVATFNHHGRYANDTGGASHAAVLLAEHEDGSITVFDQWLGQDPHQRVIRNRNGAGHAVDDSSRFYAVEIA